MANIKDPSSCIKKASVNSVKIKEVLGLFVISIKGFVNKNNTS